MKLDSGRVKSSSMEMGERMRSERIGDEWIII